jgi:breast cancer 2 susceptibility protein
MQFENDTHLGVLDDKWFYNHYRWVVWKLAAYEVSSPHQFAGR